MMSRVWPLLYVGRSVDSLVVLCETRKSRWKKTDPTQKGEGKLSIKLSLTWDPTASVITVRYTTANDYVSNPISASKALRISTTSAISTASREEGKGPNKPNTKTRSDASPFFLFPVYTLN